MIMSLLLGPTLLKYLKQVITSPKTRSEKWVSTSVPQAQWKDAKAQLSSAEYHTNNLLVSLIDIVIELVFPGVQLAVAITGAGEWNH